jgi:DNA-binding NarL/FixJ family response regulator
MTISLLLVDDHPVFLFGLRTLLAAEPDLQIVGEAMTGAEALALSAREVVDVVLMDINLPDMNGVEVARRMHQACPTIHILMLTMLDDSTVFGALKAGASGISSRAPAPMRRWEPFARSRVAKRSSVHRSRGASSNTSTHRRLTQSFRI